MTTTNDETTQIPTGIALTALDPAFREDPQPAFDALRAAEPVHYDQVLRRYALTRHDDVAAVLKNRGMSVDPRNALPGTLEAMFLREGFEGEPSMLLSDPPYHTRLRAIVSKAFTPRAIETMAPRIQQIVDELLDAVATGPGFDLIEVFAAPLPTIVIAEMLGVDPAERGKFKEWSDTGVMSFNPVLSPKERARVDAANEALHGYFARVIADRRAHPADDMVSAIIAAEENGERLNDQEVNSMCTLLLAAGNVTTTDLIGNGVHALLRFPEQLRKLQADPSLIKNAIEEMLRFDPPVTQSGRVPLSDVEIGGCPIGKGRSITPFLAAANHDPGVYPEPHRLDITRADTHHNSFGGGVHFCLGAPLARLEAQIAIGTLVRRFPDLRLGNGPRERRSIPSFRGFSRLPVLI